MLETPPNWQSWTFMEVCYAAFAVVAACLAAYGAARLGLAPWVMFIVFAVTLAFLLAGIVHSQAKRRAVYEEDYGAWLERRVGGPPNKGRTL
jgi:intracellular septation protein A